MKKVFYFLFAKSIGFYINILSFLFPKKAIDIAHGYFSQPRKGKFSLETMPKTLKEAKKETFNFGQETIQTYIWHGNETNIFLIHGWESNSSRWKKILPFLKKSGSTIIAIDGPAQGLSSGIEFIIPKYAEVIDLVSKKYPPNYLIGHSMGGQTSLYYQHRFKNPSVQKIVSLGAPCDFIISLKNYTDLIGLNSKMINALKSRYNSLLGYDISLFSSKEFVKNFSAKGLIVHDVEDKVVLFEEGKKIASSWKNAQFIETSGLGHKLHDDGLYDKIADFLMEEGSGL